eukprot:jgi/Psemu1/327628/estExt_fgenesh1_pg.C_7520008
MMPQNFHSAFLFLACLLAGNFSVDATKVSARLRGKHFAALEERARNPDIDESIYGKTLKELGIEQSSRQSNEGQGRRMFEEQVTISFFSIYDEFGPKFGTLGDTAGVRGIVYDTDAKDDGLTEEHVEGAIQGTCTVVASDGKQLCSYEIFILNPETDTFGTVVATGTIAMIVGMKNVLIIEATGDDYIKYKGGMITITYTAVDSQTVMDLDLTFRR